MFIWEIESVKGKEIFDSEIDEIRKAKSKLAKFIVILELKFPITKREERL